MSQNPTNKGGADIARPTCDDHMTGQAERERHEITQNTEQKVRTREEQLAAYPETVCVGQYPGTSWVLEIDADDLDPDRLVEDPVRYLRGDISHQKMKDAEARGAAEQRRKDVEGCEPIYQIEHEDGVWHEYFPGFWKEADYPEDRKRTLYTHPANVAALEARVKVLEEEKLTFRRLVSRAQMCVPELYEGWHIDARAALKREGEV